MYKQNFKLLSLIIFLLVFSNIYAQWQDVGGITGGTVNSIKVIGSSIIAGTQWGIYKSTDNGNNWTISENILKGKSVSILEVSGSDLFAVIKLNNGNEVYISSDNGNSWNLIANGLYKSQDFIWSITTFKSIVYLGTEHGVYKWIKEKNQWEAASNGIDTYEIVGLASDETFILAGTFKNGVFISTDEGKNWRAINNGLPENSTSPGDMESAGNLFIVDHIFYLGRSGYPIIYVSKDFGNNWVPSTKGLSDIGYPTIFLKTNTELYIGSQDCIYKLSGDGDSWQLVSNRMTDTTNVFTLNSLIEINNNLYAGTNVGIYFSADKGYSWNPSNNGIMQERSQQIISYCIDKSKIFIYCQQRGVWSSSDSGDNWTPIKTPFNYISSMVVDDSLFIIGKNDGIYRSSDFGVSWNFVQKTAKTTVILIKDGDTVYAGTYGDGFYMSTDRGKTWKQNNQSLSGLALLITAIDTNRTNVYVSTSGGMFTFKKGEQNWTEILEKNIHCSRIVANNIYVGTSDNFFQSADGGQNWTSSYVGSMDCITSVNSDIFACVSNFRYGGVIGYSFEKNTWRNLNDNLYNFAAKYIFTNNKYLVVVATFIKRRLLADVITGVVENYNKLPAEFSLSQNYPNPFNPGTVIKYSIPLETRHVYPSSGAAPSLRHVALKVYDVLGREIATIVNEVKPAGNYEIKFDGTKYPSGVYFYRISAGNFVQTKKMILLK